MSKHTPGPWEISDYAPYGGASKCLVGSDGQGFAHTVGLSEPTDAANARLIAAAPELLEALKYARRMLRDELVDREYIDAAIAKAETP